MNYFYHENFPIYGIGEESTRGHKDPKYKPWLWVDNESYLDFVSVVVTWSSTSSSQSHCFNIASLIPIYRSICVTIHFCVSVLLVTSAGEGPWTKHSLLSICYNKLNKLSPRYAIKNGFRRDLQMCNPCPPDPFSCTLCATFWPQLFTLLARPQLSSSFSLWSARRMLWKVVIV